MQNQASFWDKTAKKYAAQPIGNMDAYTETLVRTRTYLHPDHKVLELGCGTGTTALRLADAVADYTASLGRRRRGRRTPPTSRSRRRTSLTPP